MNWISIGEGADFRITGRGTDLSVVKEFTLRDDGLGGREGAVALIVRKSGIEDVEIFREGGGGGGIFRFEASVAVLGKESLLMTGGRFAKGGTGGALDGRPGAASVLAILELEEDAEIDWFV